MCEESIDFTEMLRGVCVCARACVLVVVAAAAGYLYGVIKTKVTMRRVCMVFVTE